MAIVSVLNYGLAGVKYRRMSDVKAPTYTFSNILAIAGGGAGAYVGNGSQGGGGAGGYIELGSTEFDTEFLITIGSGAAGTTTAGDGADGGDTIVGVYTAVGGGGGGGAGAAGQGVSIGPSPARYIAGDGGAGTASTITGSSVTRAGGGGGAARDTGGVHPGPVGRGGPGPGGGGFGGYWYSPPAFTGPTFDPGDGTVNTGSGGGGAANVPSSPQKAGGNGGSGVVILRWPSAEATITVGAGLTYSTTTDGSDTVATFTAGSDLVTVTVL